MRGINLITSPRPWRQAAFSFPDNGSPLQRRCSSRNLGADHRSRARIDGFIAHVKAISRDRGLCLVFGVGGGGEEARPFHYMPQRYDLRGAVEPLGRFFIEFHVPLSPTPPLSLSSRISQGCQFSRWLNKPFPYKSNIRTT